MPRNMQELEGCGPLSEPVRRHAAEVLAVVSSQLQIGPSVAVAAAAAGASQKSSSGTAATSAKPPKGRQQGASNFSAVAFDSSTATEGSSADRLYGRALQTPSKEVLQKAGGAASADEDADPLFGSPSNTIFTFTPAVVPIQQMQHHRALQGELGSSSGTMARGLVAMSPPLGRDSKPSPVMNADDVSSSST